MSRKIRSMTKKQKKNMENTFSIFDTVRSLNPQSEKRFMALPHSILNHPSFTSMKSSSKLLYIYMTDYVTKSFCNEFTYPHKVYKNIVSNETFKTCIEELKEHGFIEITSEGIWNFENTTYKFSTKWKEYKPITKKKRKTKIVENRKKYIEEKEGYKNDTHFNPPM